MVDDDLVTERRVPLGDVTLNVAEAGSGPPVLLLHGFPDSWHMWRHQIRALAGAGYHVIAPDLRGYGESDRPTDVEEYAMTKLVGDVVGVLDATGVGSAAVVGHDWGAGLAWVFASFMPERVEKLAVLSVGHPSALAAAGLRQRQRSWYMLWFQFPGVAEAGLSENEWAFFRQWAHGGAKAGDDPDVDRQIADLSRPGALSTALNWYRANISPATYHRETSVRAFPRVTCPTMGIWSSRDMVLCEEQMTESRRFVDGPWRYERIEDVGHWIPVHAPAQLNAILLDFLGS